jgi:hypothetical protein
VRAILTVIVASTGLAAAQPASPPADDGVPPAQKLFADGLALLDAHQPAEACAKFEDTLKLDPDAAGPMLNLGICNEQLDKLATALKWFRKVETRAAELHNTDAETAAKERSTALAPKVPTLKIVATAPAGKPVVVTVDGKTLEEVDLGRYEVDAGHHVVVLVNIAKQEIDVSDGDNKTVELAPPPPPPPPPAPKPVVQKQYTTIDRGADQRRLAYIVGGVGAGLLVADTVLLVIAKSEYDGTQLPAPRESWRNAARYGGTSMFVVGTGAIAAAAWLYFRAPGPERIEQTVLAPVVDRTHVGLAFSRSF